MITLFIPLTYSDINVSAVVQTRLNMDYTLDEGFMKTRVTNCKRVNAKGECYGIYLTYKTMLNIETIMQKINEPDDLPVSTKFECYKDGHTYVVYKSDLQNTVQSPFSVAR